jgi:dynein heavy chain
MPAPEFYGAQPTIELLRQFLDQKGFYDRTKLYWKDVVDTTLIACGATPGGGRNQLSRRFLRHFLVLCMPQPSDSNMKKIFESILKGFLMSYPFADNVRKSSEQLTIATLQFYKQIST